MIDNDKDIIISNQNNADELTQKKLFYCRKCGRQLRDDSVFCDACGTRVVPEKENTKYIFNAIEAYDLLKDNVLSASLEDDKDVRQKQSKHRIKLSKHIIVLSLIPILIVVLGFVGWRYLQSLFPIKHDINAIDGAPEFYNVQFGMSKNATINLIGVEYKISDDGYLFLPDSTHFYVYGIRAKYAMCEFNKSGLYEVYFGFSKESTSYETIKSLYERIYGPPENEGNMFATWIGKNTIIEVYDSIYDSDELDLTCVRYKHNPNNQQYSKLDFNGPEYDPCNFISGEFFKKQHTFYTNNLKQGDYYTMKRGKSYSTHTIYPYFSYMGIRPDKSAICFDEKNYNINLFRVSYMFIIRRGDKVSEKIEYMKDSLVSGLGSYNKCSYTQLSDSSLSREISYNMFKNQVKYESPGIYSMEWRIDNFIVTLSITIDNSKMSVYYMGKVSIEYIGKK